MTKQSVLEQVLVAQLYTPNPTRHEKHTKKTKVWEVSKFDKFKVE